MRKILVGLITAVVIAGGSYFGFALYAQHRARTEVEATFESMRSAGAKASHGAVTYDPWKRTVTIADIASESSTQPPTSIKIGRLIASDVGHPETRRISAGLIEAADVEINFAIVSGGSELQYRYKLPKLTLTNWSGPAQAPQPPAGASAIDFYRFVIAQFVQMAASSMTIPMLSATTKLNSAVSTGNDISYSGISIQDIRNGKVATAKVEKGSVTSNTQMAGKVGSFNGTFTNLVLRDFDAAAAATVLDPPKAGDDRSYRVYRRVSIDGYDVTSQSGLRMHLDRIALDDLAVRPSRLQLPAVIAAIPPAGTTPPPAQARQMLEKLAGIYEGLHIGNFEISGISIETPQGLAKLSAVRFNLDNGKGDIGLDGLEARTPQGPLRAGHLILKSVDLAKLMRLMASMAPPGQKPPSLLGLAWFQLIRGAELKDFVAPSKEANKPIAIDNFSISWGQFVGPIPTQAHLDAKLTAPVAAGDARLSPLLAAGIQTARIDADLGAGWTESSGTFALEPATIEIGGLAKAQLRILLANVPREAFDPQQAATAAAKIEAGAIELTLRDLGGVDVLVSQYARSHNIGHDAARSAILDAIRSNSDKAVAANPDTAAAVAALSRFIETPQQTLIIKLTPIGKVPALPLLQLLKTDPFNALAPFKIEASTGL